MTPYDTFFKASSIRWGVPQQLLEAIAWTESTMGKFDGPGDGVGIMQVLLSTAQALGFTGTEAQLRDPATNIHYGAAAAADIINRQGGIDLANFYSEYNSGRAQLWKTSTQVRTHVSNFLKNVAKVVGVELPANFQIEDALKVLSLQTVEGQGALLLLLGLLFLFRLRK